MTRGNSLVAGWREARRLYPVYMALAAQFRLGDPPYKDVRALRDSSEPEVIEKVGAWLAQMDDRIQVHQFRQVLQNADSRVTEDRLHSLINRYLRKPAKSEGDRDKVDFLLAQYFAVCAPPSFHNKEISVEDVAEVLEPVLGECPTEVPAWLDSLEPMIALVQRATGLSELLMAGVIEKGREAKVAAGERYFGGAALVAFTRFTWLLRRHCTRVRNLDLDAIESGLRKLAEAGVESLDCRAAGLQLERLSSVEEICRNARTETAWAYGANDVTFTRLIRLRSAVEAALGTAPADSGAFHPVSAGASNAELAATVAGLAKEIAALRTAIEAMHGALKVVLRGQENAQASAATTPEKAVLEIDNGPTDFRPRSSSSGMKMSASSAADPDLLRV